jgi:hypothetical protein
MKKVINNALFNSIRPLVAHLFTGVTVKQTNFLFYVVTDLSAARQHF